MSAVTAITAILQPWTPATLFVYKVFQDELIAPHYVLSLL